MKNIILSLAIITLCGLKADSFDASLRLPDKDEFWSSLQDCYDGNEIHVIYSRSFDNNSICFTEAKYGEITQESRQCNRPRGQVKIDFQHSIPVSSDMYVKDVVTVTCVVLADCRSEMTLEEALDNSLNRYTESLYIYCGKRSDIPRTTTTTTSSTSTSTTIGELGRREFKAVLLSNPVDNLLATELILFLRDHGYQLSLTDASDFFLNKKEDLIIILGGHNSPEGVGEIVEGLLTEDEKNALLTDENSSQMYVKENVWSRQKIIIFAGYDQYDTRKAWKDNMAWFTEDRDGNKIYDLLDGVVEIVIAEPEILWKKNIPGIVGGVALNHDGSLLMTGSSGYPSLKELSLFDASGDTVWQRLYLDDIFNVSEYGNGFYARKISKCSTVDGSRGRDQSDYWFDRNGNEYKFLESRIGCFTEASSLSKLKNEALERYAKIVGRDVFSVLESEIGGDLTHTLLELNDSLIILDADKSIIWEQAIKHRPVYLKATTMGKFMMLLHSGDLIIYDTLWDASMNYSLGLRINSFTASDNGELIAYSRRPRKEYAYAGPQRIPVEVNSTIYYMKTNLNTL
jgi:hypothetical protein